jgi:putative tryptophan/tyrosine transport system substrate-binding protein
MRRRKFITLAGGAALTLSPSARARRAAMAVVGLLTVANLPEWATNGIRVGLAEAGYVEGRNLIIIARSADGQFGRLRALAADLVGNEVVVILAAGSPVPARASKEATTKIPIVFAYGGDPVADGLVDSLNRPGANITGATFIGTALLAKRMQLLREIVPWATDVALLVNTNGTLAERQIGDAKAAARGLRQRLHVIDTNNGGEIETAFESMSRLSVDAFVVSTDPFFGMIAHDRLAEMALRYRIPGIYNGRDECEAGGLVSYGPDKADTWRQAAVYVGRILSGEKPSDLPVVQPTKFEMIINLKAAESMGLTIPPTLLGLADEVIE